MAHLLHSRRVTHGLVLGALMLSGCGGGSSNDNLAEQRAMPGASHCLSLQVMYEANLDQRKAGSSRPFDPRDPTTYVFKDSFDLTLVDEPVRISLYFQRHPHLAPAQWTVRAALNEQLTDEVIVIHFEPDGIPDLSSPRLLMIPLASIGSVGSVMIDLTNVVQFQAPTESFGVMSAACRNWRSRNPGARYAPRARPVG